MSIAIRWNMVYYVGNKIMQNTVNKKLARNFLFIAAVIVMGFLAFFPAETQAQNPARDYTNQTDCEAAGNIWQNTGAEFVGDAGVCVESDQNKCIRSGGEWQNTGAEFVGDAGVCVCPPNLMLFGDLCQDIPETIDEEEGSSVGSEERVDITIDKDCKAATLNQDNCIIIEYLVTAINLLSAVAGMAIVGSIMFAGYQYMSARDNPNAIQAARARIIWAFVALFLFIFTYGILNFLVPGGVLP
jgi:hypothetical protein